MLDPITLVTMVSIGILSPSKYRAGIWGIIAGLTLATLFAYVNSELSGHYPLVDGWILQIVSCFLLAEGVYFLKRGWQAFNRTQREMDDCESYLQEMKNPEQIGKPDKFCPSSPVRSKAKLNPEPLTIQLKRQSKIWRLNLVQKIIVSLMLPVLVAISLKAVTAGMMTFQSEYWWFWLGGLSVLLFAELWLWRGKVPVDKNID
jgi:hypothetical protein